MTVDLAVRIVCIVLVAGVGGMAFTRAFRRRDLYRWSLLTLAAFALKDVYAQLSLLHDPISGRTVGTLIAAAFGLVWIVLLLKRKAPPDKGKGQD